MSSVRNRKPQTESESSNSRARKRIIIPMDEDDSGSDEDSITSFQFRKPGTPVPGTSRSSKNVRRTEEDSENYQPGTPQPRSQGRGVGGKISRLEEEGLRLNHNEMVANAVYYFTMTQGKFVPVRKSDFLKTALNKQSADFLDVIEEVVSILQDTFGIHLIGIKNGPDGNNVQCRILEASSFMTVSKFRRLTASHVMPEKTFGEGLKRAALLMILAPAYMLDRNLDEDTIWKIFEKMKFSGHLCKKREDLRRFLKSEYVDCLYLRKFEIKDADQVTVKYGWGLRAELEFSKYALLKFVAEFSNGKELRDFPLHFSKFTAQEIQKIDEEDMRMRNQSNNEESENESESRMDVDLEDGGDDSPDVTEA